MALVFSCACLNSAKLVLQPWCVLACLFGVVVAGCSDDGRSHHANDCWYGQWYFWFIIAIVLLTIVIIILMYCQKNAKPLSQQRGRRHQTQVLALPIEPPSYDEPGHLPPPYHIATAARQPCSVHQVLLPGSVMDVHNGNLQSFSSTMSIDTISSPPPYSPPHSANSYARPC